MSAIHIGGGESVRITFPDGDDWDGDDMIAVMVEGEQVGAWSIVEDPRAEAEIAARSYSAVYEKGYRDGLQKSVDLYDQQVQAMADKEAS